jgi:pimeloyl-ACP methyl ester carboxylesterase
VRDRWLGEFDWRAQEAHLNAHPHVLADFEGATVHAMQARSKSPHALPLVLLHGWPSTLSEFRHVVAPLTDPSVNGGSAGDAFDVIAVSLPGFGFGGPTRAPGWDATRMAEAIAALVRELGVDRYGVFGTDAGAYVASALASIDEDAVAGMHLHIGGVRMAAQMRADQSAMNDLTDVERKALDDLSDYERNDSGYALINGTKPNTIGYALTDSPLGQAAWIVEKFRTWSDRSGDLEGTHFGAIALDDILTIVTTYWVTGTASSAARFYAEAGASLARTGLPVVRVPTGCAAFPGDIVTPSRRWAERTYPNIVHWTDMPRGGHFSALEVPQLLVEDLRAFFRPLR